MRELPAVLGRAAVPAVALTLVLAGHAAAASCPRTDQVHVPGAEFQETACLDDLSTKGTQLDGHTDVSDWNGLNATGTRNPSGFPGLQVDGYFPDTSTSNAYKGRNHDSQFVIRLPNNWNGKLVITGAPGVRRQFANDFLVSDWVLDRGYAFASTDKGNDGVNFFLDGINPGDAVAEWNRRITELTLATKEVVRQRYGRSAARTYITGISNGGYLTRYALENRPDLYDGGVDWEGTLLQPQAPNLFTYLPAALKYFPRYRATGDRAAHDAMIAAGFEPGSEFLWDDHYGEYWDLTQRTYREEFDPGYDGQLQAGVPFCQSGTPSCDADYDYSPRPQAVKDALSRVAVTGRIGRPMLTLHGTLDSLLPIRTDSDVYTRKVRAAGRGADHRYYVVEAGNHVDGRYDRFPDRLRPILPCQRAAFTALERWVEQRTPPPPSQFVPNPRTGDKVNSCGLASASGAGSGGGPRVRLRAPRLASDSSRGRSFLLRLRARGAVEHYVLEVRSGHRWRRLASRLRRSSFRFRGRAGRRYRFRARAVLDGRAGPFSRATTLVPLDDGARGARFGRGWARVRAARAWGRRLTRSLRRGARLRFRFRSGSGRFYLVGRTAPRGGRALVTLDGHRRTVSFRSRRTRERRVVARLRVRGRRVHTLRLVSLSGGVWIDALAVPR
jgi:hypothetical protein